MGTDAEVLALGLEAKEDPSNQTTPDQASGGLRNLLTMGNSREDVWAMQSGMEEKLQYCVFAY